MTITQGTLPPSSKSPPMTDAEMAQMWRNGDPMSLIADRARRRNGLNKEQAREIVLRECGLVEMGGGR